MFKFVSLVFLVFVIITQVTSEYLERSIVTELNPGCTNPTCSNNFTYNVVHIRAIGPNDTLHYLWDLSKRPSLLLAVTSHLANLSIDWDHFGHEGSVNFSEKPVYSFGIVLNKMWEFNDVNDTGLFKQENKSANYVRELETEKFSWERVSLKNDSKTTSFHVQSKHYYDGNVKKNGTVKIELQGFGFVDHSKVLPHLLHTANTTQVDFIIDGLAVEPSFQNSRFAVELVAVGSDASTNDMQIISRKSLDDEHAPGVFTLVDLESPMSALGSLGGYLQWRPVAYISKYRDVANSTDINVYSVNNISHPSLYLTNTVLHSYYNFNNSKLLVQSTVVSFGSAEDGYYKKSNYLSWTFTMGYGKPPDEDFSLLVILVISIGLGLPALLIIVSGIVMFIRRITKRKDDLFLGR